MSAKQESEKLMNEMLPFAEKMLREYGEFHPFGGYMKPNGEIVHVGAEDVDTAFPTAKDLIYILRHSFQEKARAEQCKATAIVFNIAVKLPESNDKSDAVQICLDHVDGYSVEVFFPYRIVDGELVYAKTFAQKGEQRIFAQLQ